MSIQGVDGKATADGRFAISWEVIANPQAFSIQVATDSEFTVNVRTFILPAAVKQCILDVGGGRWFYRCGAWIGTQTEGMIDWSGIYGPILISSPKSICGIAPFPIIFSDSVPALSSIIFYTGNYEEYYMIVHISEKEDMKASGIHSFYFFDSCKGKITVPNLSPEKTYFFHFQMLATQKDKLFKDRIQLLTEAYAVKEKRTAMVVKPTNGTESATYAADRAMLNDAVGRTRQQFFSYAQYLQYRAAKARTSARQN